MALTKYLFDLDFSVPKREAEPGLDGLDPDGEELPPEEPPPPPPPTFSEEELQLARDQAYEAGRQAATEEMQAASERQLAMALTLASDQMGQLRNAIHTAVEEASVGAVRVATAVAARLLPEMARKGRLDELTAMAAECLNRVIDEPRLVVRCHEQVADDLRVRLDEVAANIGYEGKVVVNADTRLALGDLRVEWTDGGAERDEARLWQEISEVLERSVGVPMAPPADTAAPVDQAAP